MKIKVKPAPYEKVINFKKPKNKKPIKPLFILRTLVRVLAIPDLLKAKFSYSGTVPKEPCLILMNHSSFIDLKIVYKIFYPRPFGIVCTSDGFVGKSLLMRLLGCIPTKKFVTDVSLISNIKYLLNKKKTSVLMYPEASYSFDGTATPLPRKLGVLIKKLNVPVVFIETFGAFTRDPLYNCLQIRDVAVSANVKTLINKEQIKELSVSEIDEVLDKAFSFDHFKWQKENKIKVQEDFRADGLNRILYKCANCGTEGQMVGQGEKLTCNHCKKEYLLTEYGELKALSGQTEFSHIPSWYNYERECVKKEIENGVYNLNCPVKIGVMVNYNAIYMVGEGTLQHNNSGFTLKNEQDEVIYTQKPISSYSLYADYFWYEIGDVICIGDNNILYYCFPLDNTAVAKTRLAAEELYKKAKLNRKKETVQ